MQLYNNYTLNLYLVCFIVIYESGKWTMTKSNGNIYIMLGGRFWYNLWIN